MHRFVMTRGRARSLFVVLVAVFALAVLVVRPTASAQDGGKGGPPGKDQGKDPKEKEEHGGDIVFQVQDKKQKYSVLYSHEKHLSTGLKCDDCHEKVFQKKMGANKFRMKDITDGKFCGTCHTEKPAADVKHASFAPKKNCQKCHNVRVREEK
jgi:c(7)-type cytochrome triheme protein